MLSSMLNFLTAFASAFTIMSDVSPSVNKLSKALLRLHELDEKSNPYLNNLKRFSI